MDIILKTNLYWDGECLEAECPLCLDKAYIYESGIVECLSCHETFRFTVGPIEEMRN